jgi:hypothetical protein
MKYRNNLCCRQSHQSSWAGGKRAKVVDKITTKSSGQNLQQKFMCEER